MIYAMKLINILNKNNYIKKISLIRFLIIQSIIYLIDWVILLSYKSICQ
jgi:hypothetical protein